MEQDIDRQKMTPDQIKAAICHEICVRFVDQRLSTDHDDLVILYEAPEALRDLRDMDFIEGLGNHPGIDKAYVPNLGAFVLGGDEKLLQLVKSGMVMIVRELRQLFLDRMVRAAVPAEPDLVLNRLRSPGVSEQTLQLGLLFACDSGSEIGGKRSDDGTTIEQVYVQEGIVKLRDPEQWMEEKIEQCKSRFENSKRDYSIPRLTVAYSVQDNDSIGMISSVEVTDSAPDFSLEPLNLHPKILEVSKELFADGHHWPAVFEASKALMTYIKERSGRMDLDGTGLARTVFSKNNPILAFNDLVSQTDHDEQEGMMHLFTGAVLGIRNPGGHKVQEGPPQRAFEYICFLSLLAYRVQEAKHRDEKMGASDIPTEEPA